MKKYILIFFLIILFIFSLILFITYNNNFNRYSSKFKIDDINYINYYDNKYIVRNNENLYLFSNEYNKLFDISLDKVCSNFTNYDIIYRQEDFEYLNDYYEKGNLIYEYYDIHNCNLILKQVLGGINNGW